ncbi:MAG: hypothetical protein CMJ51_04270 [Planctomycetaceae bacterium]|nr:hypothetical protein [Planctomycetaceae bacterium]
MKPVDSGLALIASATLWSLTADRANRVLETSGHLTDDLAAGLDGLQAISNDGLRLGLELARGERLGTLIDQVG